MQTTEEYKKIDIPYILKMLDINMDVADLAESEVLVNDVPVRFITKKNVNKNGNNHIFFICPNKLCNKPRRYLYMIPLQGEFVPLCRKCAGLIYPSQKLSGLELARAAVKRQLLKMGADPHRTAPIYYESYFYNPPQRKPYQRRAVYQREVDKLCRLIEREKKEFIRALEKQGLLAIAIANGLVDINEIPDTF